MANDSFLVEACVASKLFCVGFLGSFLVDGAVTMSSASSALKSAKESNVRVVFLGPDALTAWLTAGLASLEGVATLAWFAAETLSYSAAALSSVVDDAPGVSVTGLALARATFGTAVSATEAAATPATRAPTAFSRCVLDVSSSEDSFDEA